jgi:FAD/FMN-containing dehydrogenase
VFLFAVRDLQGVLRLFRAARSGRLVVTAFEYMGRNCLERVRAHRGLRAPFFGAPAEFYVLVEVEEPPAEEVLLAWLEDVQDGGIVTDGVLAQSQREAQELWALREGISESLARTGMPHKNDVALPIARLEAFCADLMGFMGARYPGWEIFTFGHIGDGNLHINVMKPEALEVPAFLSRVEEVDHDLFRLVQRHGGSISAEHGIGLLKKAYLPYSRTPEELEVLRAVKRALDPRGILNPGKIFDL